MKYGVRLLDDCASDQVDFLALERVACWSSRDEDDDCSKKGQRSCWPIRKGRKRLGDTRDKSPPQRLSAVSDCKEDRHGNEKDFRE